MKRKALKKYLLLVPVILLLAILLFLYYTVNLFRDTAYTFLYNTNVQSVLAFGGELRELAAQGFTSDEYGNLYTNMILNFNSQLGQKDAIVTFLMDEEGRIHHSTENNQSFLEGYLEDETNRSRVDAAFKTRDAGDITIERDGEEQKVYFQHFYSGSEDYTMFMLVEMRAVESQLDVRGVVIPICAIGLLLLFMTQHHLAEHMPHANHNDAGKVKDNGD